MKLQQLRVWFGIGFLLLGLAVCRRFPSPPQRAFRPMTRCSLRWLLPHLAQRAPNRSGECSSRRACASPARTPTPEPAPSPAPSPGFAVGNELTVAALSQRQIDGSPVILEQQLEDGANYARYIASYLFEGNRIYGLLTVPFGDAPEGGHKAIVFIHGYIPPDQYRTTERYVAYVDALACVLALSSSRSICAGFGESEGEPSLGRTFRRITALTPLPRAQELAYSLDLWTQRASGCGGTAWPAILRCV